MHYEETNDNEDDYPDDPISSDDQDETINRPSNVLTNGTTPGQTQEPLQEPNLIKVKEAGATISGTINPMNK